MAIFELFLGALEAMRRQRQRRIAVDSLLGLDDRMLADLGLHRCEVLSAVLEADGHTIPRERRLGVADDGSPSDIRRAAKVRAFRPAEAGIPTANDPRPPRRSA